VKKKKQNKTHAISKTIKKWGLGL